mgnify:FL=1|jgi:hypothetical protein
MSEKKKKTGSDNAENTTAVALPQPAAGSVSGEIETSDLVVPSLKMAAKTGELGELFMPGSLVLNAEYALYGARADEPEKKKEDPVWLTILHAKKSYYEHTEYGSGEMPKTADTLDEVLAQGGSLEWVDGAKPTWNPQVCCTVLVRGDDEAYFPWEFGKHRYAMARWILSSFSAYNNAAKPILTAAALNLRAGLEYGSWKLSSALKKKGGNSWYIPVLTTGEKNDEKFAAWARELTR